MFRGNKCHINIPKVILLGKSRKQRERERKTCKEEDEFAVDQDYCI